MGVKYFFRYLKEKHSSYIEELQGRRLSTSIDALLLDMNGIFHPEAQKAFFAEKLPSLLSSSPEKSTEQKEKEMFQGVCRTIDKYISIVSPTKYVVLCVDGTAPLSKQNQQRQRRFRSKSESKSDGKFDFDRNCLTPATEFMDKLTKHVHFHLKKLALQHKQLSFVFSNEKVAGEGEQKLMAFVRKNPSLSYCMVGLDADLIFLGLSCPAEKFYILREDQYNLHNDYIVLNVGGLRESLLSELKRPSVKSVSLLRRKYYINDFVFMCFAVGNDFLPHVPAIEILENGMEILFDVYQQTLHENISEQETTLPLTTKDLKFNKNTLKKFYKIIADKEQEIFNEKHDHKDSYFPDPLLSSCYDGSKIDIALYSSKYYEKHFPNVEIKTICHEYLKGLFWIITYYLKSVPSWTWRFPYQYAPFAHDLFLHIDTFQFEEFPATVPTLPFIQLLSVLPKSSSSLLPPPLSTIIQEEKALQQFFPESIIIDLAGKKQDWEGIVILPQVDYNVVSNIYFEHEDEIPEEHQKRNKFGNSFLYIGSEVRIHNFTDK